MRIPPIALALLLVGCTRRTPGDGSGGGNDDSADAKGTLTLRRDGVVTTSLALDECWSGQMLSFYGVEVFHDPDVGKRLRVVEDPVQGTRLVLIGLVAGRERVVVDRGACSKFDVLEGSIALECAVPDVGTLSVDAKLTSCSFDNRVKGM